MLPDRIETELRRYEELLPGWDGPRSPAIFAAALADTRAFLTALPRIPDDLEPCPHGDGGVGLDMNEGDVWVNILFYGEGQIAYYATNGETVARGTAPFSAAAPTVPPDLAAFLATISGAVEG